MACMIALPGLNNTMCFYEDVDKMQTGGLADWWTRGLATRTRSHQNKLAVSSSIPRDDGVFLKGSS